MPEYVIDKIDDYNENLSLVLTQFQDSTNLLGIISAANDSANDIETALFEIRDEMDLESAVGVQLDILGKVFNEERDGLSDDDYRAVLRVKGATSYSGEPEAIISILKSMFGASFVKYVPQYPGNFYMYTDLDLTHLDIEFFAPAGVGSWMGFAIVDEQGNYIVDEPENHIIAVL